MHYRLTGREKISPNWGVLVFVPLSNCQDTPSTFLLLQQSVFLCSIRGSVGTSRDIITGLQLASPLSFVFLRLRVSYFTRSIPSVPSHPVGSRLVCCPCPFVLPLLPSEDPGYSRRGKSNSVLGFGTLMCLNVCNNVREGTL